MNSIELIDYDGSELSFYQCPPDGSEEGEIPGVMVELWCAIKDSDNCFVLSHEEEARLCDFLIIRRARAEIARISEVLEDE